MILNRKQRGEERRFDMKSRTAPRACGSPALPRPVLVYGLTLAALLMCNSGAAAEPGALPQRDGLWLRDGLDEYLRPAGEASAPDSKAAGGAVVRSYVCAVNDLEKYLVLRASLLGAAVQEDAKRRHSSQDRFRGMADALPLVLPLMATRFSTQAPSCNEVLVIVREYLRKYPEVLAKDADVIIEKALIEAYSNAVDP
jgi:hypothetical protein